MEDIIVNYLNSFEEKLRKGLLKRCTDAKVLDGKLLESEDIKDYWKKIEPNYIADAVPQIAQYPTVSVAWALYLGMAVAHQWDVNWTDHYNDTYETYYGDQGFDNMDDHIVCDILGLSLNSNEAKALISLVQSLAQDTISAILHEQIEPQSKMAFFAFARACDSMFSIGAAIELRKLGYKFEKLQ